ncbi:hypothetical protein BDQ17DRAFT_1399143 [Cyathus striatus]|nr:hypothetical protein BDQ17DRAFT_1399143 [Cyathus striatus]
MLQSLAGRHITILRQRGDAGRGRGSGNTTSNLSARGRGEGDKNRKLSCKECRRCCDRVFPCQSCVKRGCGSLCPEGALTSGRGSRFILANTEQLHEKIFELSDRVRQLEEALQTLQSSCSNQPHPLLAPELLRIKTSQELYGMPTQSSQTGPPPVPSERSEIAKDEPIPSSVGLHSHHATNGEISRTADISKRSWTPEVPPDILQLSSTFPFPWNVNLGVRQKIRDALPPRKDAEDICNEARRNALWQYNLDASETFLPNLLNYCYTTPIEDLSPRRLALLLMVLAIGSVVTLNRPADALHGEAYHHLARAAVCEIPLMEQPDFDELHALVFMIWYYLIFSDNRKAVGYAWNLMGFVAKLAQGLGLHRDGSRLKVIPEEHERRRVIFWELLNLDARMSLSLGRPPSICLAHVDTKPPSYIGPGLYVPSDEIVYHEWKNSFFRRCLTPMLEAMVSVDTPAYDYILELDRKVRDFQTPPNLDERAGPDTAPRYLVMQRGLVIMGREIGLLQLHRRYFTEAMSGSEAFDLRHRYAPSVLATYMGASSLISAVEKLYTKEPQLSVRFLHFWFNAFSAAVTLSLLISRAPITALASFAFRDLERACQLFGQASVILPFSGKALPVMIKLHDKSRRILVQAASPGLSEHSGYSNKGPLPKSFNNVHPFLANFAEQVQSTSSMSAKSTDYLTGPASFFPPKSLQIPDSSSEVWLPNVYRFCNTAMDTETRYPAAATPPTPFATPRVTETDTYNFDHGALTPCAIEETGYMAWF